MVPLCALFVSLVGWTTLSPSQVITSICKDTKVIRISIYEMIPKVLSKRHLLKRRDLGPLHILDPLAESGDLGLECYKNSI